MQKVDPQSRLKVWRQRPDYSCLVLRSVKTQTVTLTSNPRILWIFPSSPPFSFSNKIFSFQHMSLFLFFWFFSQIKYSTYFPPFLRYFSWTKAFWSKGCPSLSIVLLLPSLASTFVTKYRVFFFNWASPEFAKCLPVSNWFKKNVRVPDWPPLMIGKRLSVWHSEYDSNT